MQEIPRLEAKEVLGIATAIALGSGTMKKEKSKQLMETLQRAAGNRSSVVRGMPLETVAAMHGIKVVPEPESSNG